MAKALIGINPELLRWARERAGYSLEAVALILKKDVTTIANWESGECVPGYSQLEKLAYDVYKRSLALFFFPKPPDEPDPRREFRTLPDFELANLTPDTLYAIRQAEGMQVALRELNDGVNPSTRKVFRDIRFDAGTEPTEQANALREFLGVTVNAQQAWKSNEQALQQWRDCIQETGIYVFKRSFKQIDISGFCLLDDEFPIIYLNNSTAVTRQIFTLFHELAHILLETAGITKQADGYIDYLDDTPRKIEIFANRFVAEFLVPSAALKPVLRPERLDDEYIGALAESFHVSREVALRKLVDLSLVDKAFYRMKSEQWRKQFERGKRSKGTGGNYYATQATYLGGKYLRLAFSGYYQGRYGIEQLADYLNVKVQSVSGLEQFFLTKVER